MTPEQARFLYDHMTEAQKDQLAHVLHGLAVPIPKVDAELSQAGQQMADETEAWLRDRSKP